MQNEKIKAERLRGEKIMQGEFSLRSWNSGVPQSKGWKPVGSFDLKGAQEEAKSGRENINIALQEQLASKDIEIEALKSQIQELKKENETLAANQKSKVGRKPKEEV